MAEVASAVVSIMPSFRGGSSAIAKQLDGKSVGQKVGKDIGGGFTGVASKAFAPLAGILGALSIGAFVKDTIRAAGDLEQSVGAVDSVFRESAGQIHEWASASASAVGLSANAYNSSASVIGAMLTNYGVATDKVATSTNDVIGYGADLAAMFGGTTQEAVDALGAAMRGEADPAERFGLSLNKTAVKAHMAATGIENQAEATLDLIAKQMEASGAMGQFAREGETLQGAQQRLAAGWTDIQASIGNLFLPAAASATGALANLLPHVQKVIDGLAGFKELITTGNFSGILSEAFGIEEDSGLVDFVLRLREAFTGAGGGFAGLLAAAQEAFWSVVQWLSTGGIQSILDALLAGRERLFEAALVLFPAILDAVVRVLPEVVEWVTQTMLPQLIDAITQLIPALAGIITTLVPQIVGMLTAAVPALLTGAVSLFTALIDAVVAIIPTLIGTITGMLPSLISTLLGMLPGLLQTAVTLFLSLVTAVIQAVPLILAALLAMLPSLLGTLLDMLPELLTTAITLFHSLVDAVVTILPDLITMLLGTVLPKLLDTVLKMLPDLLATAIELFVSLVTAIAEALPRIVAALIGILPTLISTIIGMIPQLITAAVQLFLALVVGIGKALPDILYALAMMGPSMIKELTGIDLVDAGVAILTGFLRGLRQGFEAVKDFVGGIGSWIANNKGPKAYDLALLRPAGGWIMTGLREGIEGEMDALRGTLGNVTSAIQVGANLGAIGVGADGGNAMPGGVTVSGNTFQGLTADEVAQALHRESRRLAAVTGMRRVAAGV